MSFRNAFMESVRVEAPYWIGTLAVLTLAAVVDAAWFDAVLVVLLAHVAVGACAVFVVLKHPSSQQAGRLDLLGAARNVYRALWWPWYLWNRLRKNK